MPSTLFPHQTHYRRWVLVFLGAAMMLLWHTVPPLLAAPPAQTPLVIDASDDDPENKLWNCEINRVPFGNQEVDRSRCFTFRYTVPPQGITSATVHIALDTLGSLQDTDATIVAVAAPVENCAWGVGAMPGCVVLHGGFQGGEKSLNLNLLDIACDPSIPNTAEAQKLVLDALDSGVLHMELQDDTAVYSAQLVLNGDAPAFTCGTSAVEVSTFVPTPGAAATTTTTQGTFGSPLDQIFDPPQYIIHATGHGTMSGPVTDDWYFLYPNAPDAAGFLELPDGIGGTFTYTTDYSDGPFNNPRELCAAAGTRVGETRLQAWNGGDAFQCITGGVPAVPSAPTAAESDNPLAAFFRSREANELLTGTANPMPPDETGAATAAVAGAVALGIFAAANYLISSGGFVSSAAANAMRARALSVPASRAATDVAAGAKGSAASDARVNAAPARERGASSGAFSSPTGGMSADAATGSAPDLYANSSVGVGAQGPAISGDWSASMLDKAVQEGISSVPDAKDLVQDHLLSRVEKSDKRERLLAEQARLKQLIKTLEPRVTTMLQALVSSRARDKDFQAKQEAWQKAENELGMANEELKAVVKELAALDEKKEDKK